MARRSYDFSDLVPNGMEYTVRGGYPQLKLIPERFPSVEDLFGPGSNPEKILSYPRYDEEPDVLCPQCHAKDVNGWPLKVIAQYYQVVLNMAPLPWQKRISKSFWTAQFKHKQQPAEPDEPPPSQKIQDAETAQPPGPAGHPEPEQALEAAGAQKAQLFSGGYCKSILAHIDPQNSMADTISQLKDMDLGSDVSDLEKLGVILSQRLMLIDNAYAAQDETVKMILQDAEKMSKEQDVLTEFRICILAAQERIHAFLAKKKEEEEMAKAQEELRKVKEQQAEQILSQMEALGLSPQALLELHQKRQNAAQQPIPSEAASAESEPFGPNTKKARIEEHQDSSEMVDVQVEEEEPK